MSTAIVKPVSARPASKIPPPLPASARAARDDKPPNVWERWSVVLTTAFGISMALHLILLVALAFWMLASPLEDRLSIDSGLDLNNESPTVDVSELNLKAAPAPQTDTLREHSAIILDAANATRNDGPKTEIIIPDRGGGGQGARGDGSTGIRFFGTGREANSFVFVVDCSGSMEEEERFDRAIVELERVINALKPTQKFFVIFYSNGPIPQYTDQPRYDGFRRGPRFRSGRKRPPAKSPPTRLRLNNAIGPVKKRTIKWVRTIKPVGGTFPGAALKMALEMKPEMIYFLTDGEIPDHTHLVIRDANKSKVRINTVALGYDGGIEYLKNIAKENNGRFRFVK